MKSSAKIRHRTFQVSNLMLMTYVLCFSSLALASDVASVDNMRGEYSYIRLHRPQKQSISKEINSSEHNI